MVGVGVIGCGDVARARYIPLLREDPRVRLLAACDIDRDALDQLAAIAPEIECGERVDDLLATPGLELVVILTPGSTHSSLTRTSLAAGYHVYCEKPLTVDRAEAAALFELARASDRGLVVAPALAWSAGAARVKELMQPGCLGPVIQAHFSCIELGPARSPWFSGSAAPYYGRATKGCLYDLGIYAIHLATQLIGAGARATARARWTGESVRSVRDGRPVTLEAPDAWAVMLEWPDGPVATVDISWAGHGHELPAMTLIGLGGTVRAPLFWLDRVGNIETWRQDTSGELVYERLGEEDLALPIRVGLGLGAMIGALDAGRRPRNEDDVLETLRLLEEIWRSGVAAGDRQICD